MVWYLRHMSRCGCLFDEQVKGFMGFSIENCIHNTYPGDALGGGRWCGEDSVDADPFSDSSRRHDRCCVLYLA